MTFWSTSLIEWARPEWKLEAKCLASDPALFYPDDSPGAEVALAKAVCNGEDGSPPCPVRWDCLDHALEHGEEHGVWGGKSERERRRLRRIRKKVDGVPRLVRTPQRSPLRKLLDTNKIETRILGSIQRHLMCREPEERRQDVIHPSEMCKSDWCGRATFFRLADAPLEDNDPGPSFTLENVFAEGHEIHHKWQGWLWEMGILRGRFQCHACKTNFAATAPKSCPLCKAARECLTYAEVPLKSEKYLIAGHADGDIADDPLEHLCPLLEVKSIGVGTLRFEAPKLLAAHTYKAKADDGDERMVTDLEGLWRDIKRPFPSHLRQGNLYMAVSGRRTMVFVYEAKWNQQVKEFRVKYQPQVVADLLDACLDIKYALESGQPPARPQWAQAASCTNCSKCNYKGHCWDPYLENDVASEAEPVHRNGSGISRSPGTTRKRRIPVTGASGLRDT